MAWQYPRTLQYGPPRDIDVIRGDILATDIEITAVAEVEAPTDFRQGRARAIEAFEADYVNKLLEQNNGNVTRAAREAGKERRAFGRLVKKYRAS